jgi:hypothetical protein
MKLRFFYAPKRNLKWQKLFVLSEDGVLYSEYLDFMVPGIFMSRNNDFERFKAKDFKFSDIQELIEIDESTAIETQLYRQQNWVKEYIQRYMTQRKRRSQKKKHLSFL